MTASKKHQSQWAAQFLTAAKLASRGFEVAFTMGNSTPLADLFAARPDRNEAFLIDVKGQMSNNFWMIKKKDLVEKLFYILVRVDMDDVLKSRFFVASHQMILEMLETYKNSGIKHDDRFTGFNWGDAMKIENNWNCLPGWEE
ncbi:MAG: hypothetical protein VR78_12270 [Hoeflea sp. BRH_c9]|nr:MAG: hypothetical protein VR78_12270 [Hoeflea sp. BRH_c9]